MSWQRTFFVLKSRPVPVLAFTGFLLDVLVLLPPLGLIPGPILTLPFLSAATSMLLLHIVAALLAGSAFPGWYGFRGAEWGIPVDPDFYPARALSTTPAAHYTVREVGQTEKAEKTPRAPPALEMRRAHHRIGPFCFAMSLCFPILGALTAAVVAILRRLRPDKFSHLIQEYRELVDSNFPLVDVPPDVRDDVVERSWAAMELRPFVDIIGAQQGEDELAVSAIESTAALDYPTASRLLRYALASSIPETRYYAAKALARIEETLDLELQQAQEAHALRPEDPVPIMRIADARLSYGEVGQEDDPLNRFHLTEAMKYYRMCLNKIHPEARDECLARLAKACLQVGEIAEAKRYYSDLVERGASAISIIQGCIEACYRDRDYRSLRGYLMVARERSPDSDWLKEVSRVWLPHGPEA